MLPIRNAIGAHSIILKDQILSSLTWKQRRVAFVAAVALSCLAVLFLFCKCGFKATGDKAEDEAQDKLGASVKSEMDKTTGLQEVTNLKQSAPELGPIDEAPTPELSHKSHNEQVFDLMMNKLEAHAETVQTKFDVAEEERKPESEQLADRARALLARVSEKRALRQKNLAEEIVVPQPKDQLPSPKTDQSQQEFEK